MAPPTQPPALTALCHRVGDRNPRGMAGARRLGTALADHLQRPCAFIGDPQPPIGAGWSVELDAARPGLVDLAAHVERVLSTGQQLVAATNRCSASLATLPVVARLRPEATVVWFDAHADANTPDTSTSGYLGGLVLTGAAGLWETGLGAGLPLERVVLVGSRDIDPAEQALIDRGVLRWVPAGPDVAGRLDAVLGDGPVYVHVDCDVLDPGVVPTEYQVAGGLSLADLQATAEVLARREVVGVEIAEFEATWPGSDEPADVMPLLRALAPLWEGVR
jgi:arginase